jgi:hypothetical protein
MYNGSMILPYHEKGWGWGEKAASRCVGPECYVRLYLFAPATPRTAGG